jgi:hypothetical protein
VFGEEWRTVFEGGGFGILSRHLPKEVVVEEVRSIWEPVF